MTSAFDSVNKESSTNPREWNELLPETWEGKDTPPPGPDNDPCACPRDGASSARFTKALKVAGGVALIGVSVPLLTTFGLSVALPVIGFTSKGIAAGSAASAIHATFYGAYASGLLSAATSLGATIVAPTALEVTTALGTVAAGGALVRSGASGARAICACTNCECSKECDCACRTRARGAEVEDAPMI